MLDPCVSGIVYLFDMLVVYFFFSRVSEKTKSTTRCLIIGLILFEIASALNIILGNNPWINTVISFIAISLFSYICFTRCLRLVVLYSFILVVLNFALELVALFFISAATKMTVEDYNNNFALLILEVAFCKFLFFCTCVVLSYSIKPYSSSGKKQYGLLFFTIPAMACLAIFGYIGIQDNITHKIQYLLAITSVVFYISVVLIFITYQHQIEQDSDYVRLKSEFNRLQTEKSYYDILEQQNENLMIYAHDAKKHLAAIQSLNHDPEIDNYVNTLSDHLKSYSKNCHSGNKLLDVMIHKYSMDCRTKGISFYYDVRQCNFRNVADIDLVAILGNLMDNAVTAASKSVKKEVSLETTHRNSYSVLIISNSCDCAPIAKGNRLLSSKDSSQLHGYGLKSVAKTLKNYHGDMRWEYDDARHTFTMTVMIED